MKEDNYILEISDKGCGFNNVKKIRTDAYGMLGMKQRAYLLDNQLTIDSIPKKGTIIRIIFKA